MECLRVLEHLLSDNTSHIFRHLHNSPQCRALCSDECFNILDHASTTFQLKIKEAIHIQWEKPTLNHQLYHVNLELSLKIHTLFCYYCLFCPISILLRTLNSTLYFVLFRTEDDRRTVEACFFLILKVSFIFLNFVGFKTVFQLLCCSNFVTLTRQIVEPYGSSSAQANSEINFLLKAFAFSSLSFLRFSYCAQQIATSASGWQHFFT